MHDEAGAVVVDSDAEVQAAIRDLFAACKFQQCGPLYLRAIPVLSGPVSGQRSPHRKCQTLPRRYPPARSRSCRAPRQRAARWSRLSNQTTRPRWCNPSVGDISAADPSEPVELIGGVEKRDIKVVPPDPAWPAKFAVERETIVTALGVKAVRVDHIGSTSIPGLGAKPIIDIGLSILDVDRDEHYLPATTGLASTRCSGS